MLNSEIYINDLANRFPTYTFGTTVDGSLTTYAALDGETPIASYTRASLADAVWSLRLEMVGGPEVLPLLTTAQRDALTSPTDGTAMLNADTYGMECVDDGIWYPAAGISTWDVLPRSTLQTDNATPTEIEEFDLDDEEVYMVQISVVGIKDDGSDRCGVIKSAVVYRDGGGNATLQGSVAAMIEEYSDSNWDVDITVSGNSVRATVTGVAATTINWNCSLQFIEQ